MILFRTPLLQEKIVAPVFSPNQSGEFGGQTGTRVMSNRTFFGSIFEHLIAHNSFRLIYHFQAEVKKSHDG